MITFRKKRTLLVLLLVALFALLLYSVFFKNTAMTTIHAANTPFTKDEQQALIALQEQQDERGDAGPLVAKVSARTAENTVLNLHPTENKNVQ